MSSKREVELGPYFENPNGHLRPILTSLNGDQSWLLSFPLPTDSGDRENPGKQYFHIVTDPWLQGSTALLSTWILGIERLTTSAATDGAAVEEIVREIECAAAGKTGQDISADSSTVDAIFIHFHYLDHMHKPSLVTFDAEIPVFATPEAAGTIRGWKHFKTVTETRDLDPQSKDGWQSLHPGGSLPEWLSVFRLNGHAELNFATAIVWSYDDANNQRRHELVLNSPHGIKIDQPSVCALFGTGDNPADVAVPPLSPLAMLAALKDSFVFGTKPTTLGLDGSLALERLVKPQYWVRSHDSILRYVGAVMRLLGTHDVARTLDNEAKEMDIGKGGRKRPNLVDIENGASFVLV